MVSVCVNACALMRVKVCMCVCVCVCVCVGESEDERDEFWFSDRRVPVLLVRFSRSRKNSFQLFSSFVKKKNRAAEKTGLEQVFQSNLKKRRLAADHLEIVAAAVIEKKSNRKENVSGNCLGLNPIVFCCCCCCCGCCCLLHH